MILRVSLRSLANHPVRSLVLACGFGLGISVMASLLGVGDVVLRQARAPELYGGGDAVVVGAAGGVDNARHVLANVLARPPFDTTVETASPRARRTLYLRRGSEPVAIRVRGGVPSLERAIGDPETAQLADWRDTPADRGWSEPAPGEILRAMDRFHLPVASDVWGRSWAEWLYFNGKTERARFYLSFIAGPELESGRRALVISLQLDDGVSRRDFATRGEVDGLRLLDTAPDLELAGNTVRLDGTVYRIELDLPERSGRGARLRGSLELAADGGESFPPFTVYGAKGWQSGYTVPVPGGRLAGWLRFDGREIPLDGGSGYHDHNWGFWRGVRWQWGQVEQRDVAIVFGRIFPPPEAADPGRLPGFLMISRAGSPLGFSSTVRIEEVGAADAGAPASINVRAVGPDLELSLRAVIDDVRTTPVVEGPFAGSGDELDFIQMRATYEVRGTAGGERIEFVANGSCETFRGR